MAKQISRREFLKLSSLLPVSYLLPEFMLEPKRVLQNSNQKNTLIIVFDAWSAANVSLYGYPRETTPHIDKLADNAIVYHNHYSAGNFTTPGTASLLTGTLPWTHRALEMDGTVLDQFTGCNIFSLFDSYHRWAYSHNPLVNVLLEQFIIAIDDYTFRDELLLKSNLLTSKLFSNDEDIASVGLSRIIDQLEERYSYSLMLSRIYEFINNQLIKKYADEFPKGLPEIRGYGYFTLEDSIEWLITTIQNKDTPFLGYAHLYPPHAPYRTRSTYDGYFADDRYHPPSKPEHIFTQGKTYYPTLEKRNWYDEYILYIDSEFSRLFTTLEQGGFLEDTWIILTSDHGELFERGIQRHSTPVLNQPVIHIPLIIFPPGKVGRTDIHTSTSAIDLLPTLLHINGQPIPSWAEGSILAPFNDQPQQIQRDIFVFEAKEAEKQKPIQEASASIIRGNYKLIYYYGYEELEGAELIELYNLDNDPEELENLASNETSIVTELLNEIKVKITASDRLL